MSALKEEVAVAKPVLAKNFHPEVEIKATSELKDNLIVVSIPEDTYIAQAEANGLTEDTIKKVQKYHTSFMKKAVVAVGDELKDAYKKHDKATGFDFSCSTTLANVEMYGDKHTTSVVKGTEYQGTGMTLKQKFNLPGLQMAHSVVKKDIYSSFNLK